MLIWDDAITTVQNFASDTSTGNLPWLKTMMNFGYKLVLASLARTVTERTQTGNTVASQQYYQLPPDCFFIKSVTVTVGGIAYPIQEEESQNNWDILNATTSQTSDIPRFVFIRPGFGIGGKEIGFWPIPSSSNNTITVVYEATDKDMSQNKYATGTVTATNNSANITGSGTTFTAQMVGRYFNISDNTGDGMWYKVASYASATSIAIANSYQGTTTAGAAYQIAEAFAIPEDIQIIPCYYAAWQYYEMKKDLGEADHFKTLFDEELMLAMRRWGNKSRSMIVRSNKYVSRWKLALPLSFPSQIT